MSLDGTFGVFDSTTNTWVWSAKIVKNNCNRLILKSDGNLVITNYYTNAVIWSTNTAVKIGSRKNPYRLVMQSDRNLVITDGLNNVIWSSNSKI
jgi:hypothetical protein